METTERALLDWLHRLCGELADETGGLIARRRRLRQARGEARLLAPVIRTLLEREDLADEARARDRRWTAYLQSRLEDAQLTVSELRREVLELTLAHPGQVTEITPTGAIISRARPPLERGAIDGD
jgi:hypothetical protein